MSPLGQKTEDKLLSHYKGVMRRGHCVLRNSGPWSKSVQALLLHLEKVGFSAAPRVIDSGFDSSGQEVVSYIEGEIVHPYAWRDNAISEVGRLLRRLHEATSSFNASAELTWKPWFLRDLGGPRRVISHGDFAPWNMVTRAGFPIALIDWEYAGPIDPIIELSRVCWLFAQLHDDDVAHFYGLPSTRVRAQQVRLLADAYGASAEDRALMASRMVEIAIHETADEAIERKITPESEGPQWGFAWKARSAAWMLRNRSFLEEALA